SQTGHRHLFIREVRKEQGNANESITAVVEVRINDAAVAFSADDGIVFFHGSNYVHLSNCRGIVLAAVLLRDVAQRAGGGKVGYRIAPAARIIFQDVVGDSYERIFFAEGRPVFAYKRQSVDVGVNYNAQVIFSFLNFTTDIC